VRLTPPIRVLIALACAALGLLPFSLLLRVSLSWETNNHVTNWVTNDGSAGGAPAEVAAAGRARTAVGAAEIAPDVRPGLAPDPTPAAPSGGDADPCARSGIVLDDFCDEGSIVRARIAP